MICNTEGLFFYQTRMMSVVVDDYNGLPSISITPSDLIPLKVSMYITESGRSGGPYRERVLKQGCYMLSRTGE